MLRRASAAVVGESLRTASSSSIYWPDEASFQKFFAASPDNGFEEVHMPVVRYREWDGVTPAPYNESRSKVDWEG